MGKDNHDKIVKTVENWKTDGFWLEADEPCQFLQNCKEYIDAVNSRNHHTFKSNVIIWNDASNSGLQHYSMERRDPVGAKDTNMTALDEGQEKSNDFYMFIRKPMKILLKTHKTNNNKQKIQKYVSSEEKGQQIIKADITQKEIKNE